MTANPHDWNGHVPDEPAPPRGRLAQLERVTDDMCAASHPGLTHAEAWPDRARGGWSNVPRWLRWFLAADSAVCLGAMLWAVIHPLSYLRMADAAFAANIPPGFDIAAGYYRGADDYHVWSPSDWARFPGYRLPITVPADPGNGPEDGIAALAALRALGVPDGSFTVVDMETRVDAEYLLNFSAAVQQSYRVWVYGSASTVFGNPPLNGYWVADYTEAVTQTILDLLATSHVRAVQYANGPGYDSSLVKAWTDGRMWTGT